MSAEPLVFACLVPVPVSEPSSSTDDTDSESTMSESDEEFNIVAVTEHLLVVSTGQRILEAARRLLLEVEAKFIPKLVDPKTTVSMLPEMYMSIVGETILSKVKPEADGAKEAAQLFEDFAKEFKKHREDETK